MKKAVIISSALLIFVMILQPLSVVTFIPRRSGMAACLIMFLAIDPVCAIAVGAISGIYVKKLWFFTLLSPVMFLVGVWLSFGGIFLVYSIIYLLLGLAAMSVSALVYNRCKDTAEAAE